MPPFVVPYLIGTVTAPLVAMVVKPIVRGTVKTTIAVALQMKKLAAEAAEDLQDFAAEISADFDTPKTETHPSTTVTTPRAGARPAVAAPKKP